MTSGNVSASIDIGKISSNLRKDDSGVWVSPSSTPISYPKENNAICFDMEDTSFWYTHRNACLCVVVNHFLHRKPLFDVGGGNGIVSKALLEFGIETFLVEPGRAGVNNARTRGLTNLICATFEDCGFHPGVLPAAGLFDILEHIQNDSGFLAEVHEALLPGGNLFVSVPAYSFLWSNHDEQVGHYRRYSLPGLSRQLTEIGFEIDYATYLFSILPVPIWFRRTLPSKLGLYTNLTSEVKRKEHHPGFRSLTRSLTWFLEKETTRIQRKKSVPFGSSCLIAARKA